MNTEMNDASRIYNETVNDVWILLHKSLINHLYHADMAAEWSAFNFWMRVLAGILLVLGLAASMWRMPIKESAVERDQRIDRSNILAVVFALISMFLFVTTTDNKQVEHQILQSQWLGVKTELEEMRNELHTLPSDEQVSPEIRGQIAGLRRRTSNLLRSETDEINKELLDKCWGDANEILYGKGIRTAEQAKEEFRRRKKDGKIPSRPVLSKTTEVKPKAKQHP